MKASDRAVMLGLLIVGLGAAFWFFALAPKREEAAELERTAATLRDEVAAQEALVTAARAAQDNYERNYASLVVLGKAAPADGDTPSLLEQLIAISGKAEIAFDSLTLAEAPEELPATGAEQTTADGAGEGAPAAGEGEAATPVAAVPVVPATEADAASLPLGAVVGAAGFGVLPYTLEFSGDFFQAADLLKGIDALVGSGRKKVDVDGRLVTVNGFTMKQNDDTGRLDTTLSVSTYVLPSSQGLTAGATETAPPESVPAPVAAPVSATPAP